MSWFDDSLTTFQMKKLILLMVGLMIFETNQGQVAFLSIEGSYAFPAFKYAIVGVNSSKLGNNGYTFYDASFSLGRGWLPGTTLQYYFNDNLGIRLSGEYFSGKKVSMSEQSDIAIIIRTISHEYTCKYFGIHPGLVLALPVGIFRPYFNLGVTVGKGHIVYDEIIDDKVNGVSTSVSKLEYKYSEGTLFGPWSVLGLDVKLSDRFTVFTEFDISSVQFAPGKGELIKATNNGVDVLNTYPVSQRQIEYSESYTTSSSVLPDETQPSKELIKRYSCGYYSCGLGIRISLL